MPVDESTELLREMRDLLRVMAEPAIAARDKKPRGDLRRAVGGSGKRGKAVILMDGSRNQATIRKESGIDQGDLSRLVKSLRAASLVTGEEKQPKLAISIPPNFFEDAGRNDE